MSDLLTYAFKSFSVGQFGILLTTQKINLRKKGRSVVRRIANWPTEKDLNAYVKRSDML